MTIRRGYILKRDPYISPGKDPIQELDSAVENLINKANKLVNEYRKDREYSWEQIARHYQARIAGQRKELKRLNELTVRLRSEAHTWREKAETKENQ